MVDQVSVQLGGTENLGSMVAQENVYMNKIGEPLLNFAKINKLFNVINSCRSDSDWLTSISGNVNGMIVISGFAQSYSDITNFIKNMEASKFIRSINLNYSNEAAGENVSFQMTFKLEKGYSFIFDSSSEKSPEITNKPSLDKKIITKKQSPSNKVEQKK